MVKAIDFKKIQPQKTIYIIGIVSLAIILDVWLVLFREIRTLKDQNKETFAIRENLKRYKNQIDREAELAELNEDWRIGFSKLENKIPRERQVPQVLEFISSVAKEEGINIRSIEPDTSKTSVSTVWGKAYPVTISLNFEATYHTLAKFLSKIERERFIIDVKKMRIAVKPAMPTNSIELELYTVLLLSNDEK